MGTSPDHLLPAVRSSNSRPSAKKTKIKPATPGKGRWTPQEHRDFLVGLERHGRDWKAVSDMVKTRTQTQTRTHHQKYDQQIKKGKSFPGEDYDLEEGGPTTSVSRTGTTTTPFHSEGIVPPSSSSLFNTVVTTTTNVADGLTSTSTSTPTSCRATRQLFPLPSPVTSTVRGKTLASLGQVRVCESGEVAGRECPRSTRSSVAAAGTAPAARASTVKAPAAKPTEHRGHDGVNGVDDTSVGGKKWVMGVAGGGGGGGGGALARAARWTPDGRRGKCLMMCPPIWGTIASSPTVGVASTYGQQQRQQQLLHGDRRQDVHHHHQQQQRQQQQRQQQQQRWSLPSPSPLPRGNGAILQGARLVGINAGGQSDGGPVGTSFDHPPHLHASDHFYSHHGRRQNHADTAAVVGPAIACARHIPPHPGAVHLGGSIDGVTSTLVRSDPSFDPRNGTLLQGAGCGRVMDIDACGGPSLISRLGGHSGGLGCGASSGGSPWIPPTGGGNATTGIFASAHRYSNGSSGVWPDTWQMADAQHLCGLPPGVLDRTGWTSSGDGDVSAVGGRGSGAGERAATSAIGQKEKFISHQAAIVAAGHQQPNDRWLRQLHKRDATLLTAAAVTPSPSSTTEDSASSKLSVFPSPAPVSVLDVEGDGDTGDNQSDSGIANEEGLAGGEWTGIEAFGGSEKFDLLALFEFEDHFGIL